MALVNTLAPIPIHSTTFSSTTPANLNMAPRVSSTALLSASATDKQSLIDIDELLNSLFTRNRNQHRRNHWFRSLQQFRKQLGLLIQEIDMASTSKKKQKLEQRLSFWDEKCIHTWYLHFTQLTATAPFAVLGLVLMACTARVCRITGITDLYEEIASEDMKMVGEMLDDGAVEEELGSLLIGGGEEEEDEDWGEVVQRE